MDDDTSENAVIELANQVSYCRNLLSCWLEMLDEGMRSGDIVDAAFDTVTMSDGNVYYDRVIYGLVFFLVVGVILFDIVTGIIVDTFASLREELESKLNYHSQTAFISGITETEYKEIGLNYDDLCNKEQSHRDYVHFMCYLKLKKATEYNGAESMINALIDRQDRAGCRRRTRAPAKQRRGGQRLQRTGGAEGRSDRVPRPQDRGPGEFAEVVHRLDGARAARAAARWSVGGGQCRGGRHVHGRWPLAGAAHRTPPHLRKEGEFNRVLRCRGRAPLFLFKNLSLLLSLVFVLKKIFRSKYTS